MTKISKKDQVKLQEVILEKTMASINGSKEETKKTSKTAKAKAEPKVKASKKAEPNAEPKKKETTKSTRSGDSKYIYPADCTDALSKKKFRANARTTLATYEKKLSALKEGSKEYKALLKEFKEYKSTILANQ